MWLGFPRAQQQFSLQGLNFTIAGSCSLGQEKPFTEMAKVEEIPACFHALCLLSDPSDSSMWPWRIKCQLSSRNQSLFMKSTMMTSLGKAITFWKGFFFSFPEVRWRGGSFGVLRRLKTWSQQVAQSERWRDKGCYLLSREAPVGKVLWCEGKASCKDAESTWMEKCSKETWESIRRFKIHGWVHGLWGKMGRSGAYHGHLSL